MPVCTKTLVQYGSGAGTVFTVMLHNSCLKQRQLRLACMALDVIGRNKSTLDDSSRVLHASGIVQNAARRQDGATAGVIVVPVLSCLGVRGTVLCIDTDTTVVYGTGVCCVDGKEIDTNIPIVHTSMTMDGVRVLVTCVLSEGVDHTRSAGHFISSGHTLCVNVRDLQLGRRCESSIVWQPMLSHFKRRHHTTDTHIVCFKNVVLELLHTKHQATPLFDVLQSQSTAGHLTCYSVFM
jgi:hypothetical protein